MSFSRAIRSHLLAVEHPEILPHETRLSDFAADEQIVRDRQGRGEGERLVNGLDPRLARIERRAEMNRLAFEENAARVDLDRAAYGLDER